MMSFIRSRLAPLLVDHVDTDQIIPGRFLKTVSQDGMGDHLFADWRRDPEFPLNHQQKDARILVAGSNFGCGSSREHAAWALKGAGYQAVIASSFADIFRANALRNQLLPVAPSNSGYRLLREHMRTNPGLEVEVDIADQRVRFGGEAIAFELDPFAKDCLLRGIDPFTYLLEHLPQIEAFEEKHVL